MEIEDSSSGKFNASFDFGNNGGNREGNHDEQIPSIRPRQQAENRTEHIDGTNSKLVSCLNTAENNKSRTPTRTSLVKSDHVIADKVAQLGFTAHVNKETTKFDPEWIESCSRLMDNVPSRTVINDPNIQVYRRNKTGGASVFTVPRPCECGNKVTDISKMTNAGRFKDNKNFILKTGNIAISKKDIVQDLKCMCGLKKNIRPSSAETHTESQNFQVNKNNLDIDESQSHEQSKSKSEINGVDVPAFKRKRPRGNSESELSDHEYDHHSSEIVTADWLSKNVTCEERESNMLAPTSF